MQVQIHSSWQTVLQEEFDKPYFENIVHFIKAEKAKGKIIYPKGADIFNAFNTTPFNKIKAVILGQDPYHGPNQAHGLCFSVLKGVAIPPSLKNIYKELQDEFGYAIPNHGNLMRWAEQGVLMLNACLTVENAQPMSHSKIGWEVFTDAVITKISTLHTGVVFLLWGRFAQEKAALIDTKKHFVLKAAHPSPFSANNGFFGCKHFSITNTLLANQQKEIINWQITDHD